MSIALVFFANETSVEIRPAVMLEDSNLIPLVGDLISVGEDMIPSHSVMYRNFVYQEGSTIVALICAPVDIKEARI
jgi:hypothetical protein